MGKAQFQQYAIFNPALALMNFWFPSKLTIFTSDLDGKSLVKKVRVPEHNIKHMTFCKPSSFLPDDFQLSVLLKGYRDISGE